MRSTRSKGGRTERTLTKGSWGFSKGSLEIRVQLLRRDVRIYGCKAEKGSDCGSAMCTYSTVPHWKVRDVLETPTLFRFWGKYSVECHPAHVKIWGCTNTYLDYVRARWRVVYVGIWCSVAFNDTGQVNHKVRLVIPRRKGSKIKHDLLSWISISLAIPPFACCS